MEDEFMPSMNIVSILSYVLAIAVGVLIYFIYAKLNISKANGIAAAGPLPVIIFLSITTNSF